MVCTSTGKLKNIVEQDQLASEKPTNQDLHCSLFSFLIYSYKDPNKEILFA